MRSLFLGLGKVNLALAKFVAGEKWGFVEEDGSVLISKSGNLHEPFKQIEKVAGDFDSFDWKKYLPGQVFVSPGVDPRRKFFSIIQESEVRELSFFSSQFSGKIIAITGTDGKSTFTLQLGEVLKRAFPKLKIFVGGNLGTGMAEGLSEKYDLAVIEISSFQAERLSSAKIDFGIILNLDTDHLDRYDSLADYHSAKWNLVKLAKESAFPSDVEPPYKNISSFARFHNREELKNILEGVARHLSTALGFEFQPGLLENLPKLRHRLERVTDKDGRVFINDSKATTVHATSYALSILQKEFPTGLKLILGGKYKGDDFSKLIPHLRATDEVLICGEGRDIIHKQLASASAKVRLFPNLKDLLNQTVSSIKPGDCLLLSPACSSYDEFKNFEERGDFFVSEVAKKSANAPR